MTDQPRVPLPDSDTLVETAPHLFDTLEIDDLFVARTMATEPTLFAAVLEYLDSLYASLPVIERELAILATARTLESQYEWHQHVTEALEAGISLETIQAIGAREDDRLDAETAALVRFVRAQCRREVTDDHVTALRRFHDDSTIVSLSLLVSHYTGTADFIDAMAIPLEEPFVGWVPDRNN